MAECLIEGGSLNLLPGECEIILCYTHFNNSTFDVIEVRRTYQVVEMDKGRQFALGADLWMLFYPSTTREFRKSGPDDQQLEIVWLNGRLNRLSWL